jgi:hypothetical protein
MCWGEFLSYFSLATFQGLLTPLIAIATVIIAYQQRKTNAYKVKLDLFERRIKVYERVRDMLALMFTKVSDDKKLNELMLDMQNAQFLFGAKLANYIEEVYRRASDLSAANKELATGYGTAEQRAKRMKTENEQIAWATKERELIGAKFRKALDLSQL